MLLVTRQRQKHEILFIRPKQFSFCHLYKQDMSRHFWVSLPLELCEPIPQKTIKKELHFPGFTQKDLE